MSEQEPIQSTFEDFENLEIGHSVTITCPEESKDWENQPPYVEPGARLEGKVSKNPGQPIHLISIDIPYKDSKWGELKGYMIPIDDEADFKKWKVEIN